MNQYCPLNSTKPWHILLILACIVCNQAMAQDDPRAHIDTGGLVIEATAGWDGVVDTQVPVPISMLVNNYGDESIEGLLYLSDPDNGVDVPLDELFVGAGATRRVSFIQNLADWNECYISLRKGEDTVWRRPLDLNTGEDFHTDVYNVLFVDDSDRKLTLPQPPPAANIATDEWGVAPQEGRKLRSLTVKSWQVPDHPGPLTVAQAIVFAEAFDTDTLNRAQWDALAKWMCQGGKVFAHDGSKDVAAKLLDRAPLSSRQTSQTNAFVVQPIGLGGFYSYSGRLLATEEGNIRKHVADTIQAMPTNNMYGMLNSIDVYRRHTGRSDWHRFTVVAFFLSYAAMSGIVSLLLFRLSRKQMGVYITAIVVSACVLSAILGALLRNSHGDLRWTSITTPGAGGIVQFGRIDVQSAGARNQQVAATGNHIDLQATGFAHRWYDRHSNRRNSHPAFTWQPNLAKSEENIYQSTVVMPPWGARRLHATAFQSDVTPLDFEVLLSPLPPAPEEEKDEDKNNNHRHYNWNQPSSLEIPRVQLQVKLTNRTSYELIDCWLVVGTTASSPGSDAAMKQYASWQQQAPNWAEKGTPIGVYHTKRIKSLTQDESVDHTLEAEFRVMNNHWDRPCSWEQGSSQTPHISRLGSSSAWIIGQLKKSPILGIDESKSDFATCDELHLFVQPIKAEDLKNTTLLLEETQETAQ